MRSTIWFRLLFAPAFFAPLSAPAQFIEPVAPVSRGPVPPELSCTAESSLRSGFVNADGSVVVYNVPAGGENLRLRLICEDPFGATVPGESTLTPAVPGGATEVSDISFDTVTPIPRALAVAPAAFRLVGAGAARQLAVSGAFAGGSTGDLTAADLGTTYRSSDPAVAAIGADGLVTAGQGGTTILTALNDGAVGFATVSVLSAPLASLAASPARVELVISPLYGTPQAQLRVDGRLTDGSTVDLTSATSLTLYSSSAPSAAAVSEGGAVAGLAAGAATVTVTNGPATTAVDIVVDTLTPAPDLIVDTPGFAHEVDLDGTVAYIADGPNGLVLFDAAGAAPFPGLAFDGFETRDVKVRGNLVAVALGTGSGGQGGIALVDNTDPTALRVTARVTVNGPVADLWLSGSRLYAATPDGLAIYDVRDRRRPKLLGTQAFSAAVRAVAGSEVLGIAVALTSAPALEVLEVSGLPPWPAATVDLPPATNQADDVALHGVSAYVANGRAGGHRIDLTDPANPVRSADTSLNMNALGVAVHQDERGVLLAFADDLFINAVPLMSDDLRNLFNIDFSGLLDANGTGVALADGLGVVTFGLNGFGVFRTDRMSDNAGQPPVVAITAPTSGEEVPAGRFISFSAVAIDDVQVRRVDLFVDGLLVDSDPAEPFTTIFRAAGAGTVHVLEARAIDFGGNAGDALPVRVETQDLLDPREDLRLGEPEVFFSADVGGDGFFSIFAVAYDETRGTLWVNDFEAAKANDFFELDVSRPDPAGFVPLLTRLDVPIGSSRGLDVDPVDDTLYSASGSFVSQIDRAGNILRTFITDGGGGLGLAFQERGFVWVRSFSQATEHDRASGASTGRSFPLVAPSSSGMAYDADRDFLWTGNWDDRKFEAYDPETGLLVFQSDEIFLPFGARNGQAFNIAYGAGMLWLVGERIASPSGLVYSIPVLDN